MEAILSEAIPASREPLLTLPGFLPDAVPFAVRSAVALLLAYLIAFFAQVDSASSAGVCVAILAQPSAGMAASKAIYRVIGTLVGGWVALMLLAAFPQDRTMLLAGFALWLGVCTFAATLLRDFRSYGAALGGYTVGIIAIGIVDTPQLALVTTLDRVAAILIGVASVLVVNNLLAGANAFDALVTDLRDRLMEMIAMVADALEGRPLRDDLALVQVAAGAAALQTQVNYAALELPDGRDRANGARHMIAALLAMVSASRAVAATLGPDTPPAIRDHLRAVADALRAPPGQPPPEPPRPARPFDALLLERADELLHAHQEAVAGLHTLVDGADPMPHIGLRSSHDIPGALLAGVRAILAGTFCSIFCILAGWGGATLVLIQVTAVIALLGMSPNPSKASLLFGAALPPVALIVGFANYLLLPSAEGFVPFSLVVAPIAVAAVLAMRHATLAPYAVSAFLYVTLLLSPANQEGFNVLTYCNTSLQLALSVLFTTLSFNLILPVSPSRRLYRVADRIGADLRRTLQESGRLLHRTEAQSLLYDRMATAMLWLGTPTPARRRLLGHIYELGELDLAIRRAHTGLAAVASDPRLGAAIAEARRSLSAGHPPAILASAETLLAYQDEPSDLQGIRQAVSGMAGAARLIGRDETPLRFYRKLML